MNKIKNISCILICITFTVFAGLQYNDPDPYLWIPLYMMVALFSIWTLIRPVNRAALILLIIFYSIGSVYMWPAKYNGITMPMDYKPEIEEARESLGLMLSVLSFSWFLLISTSKNRYFNLKSPS